MNGGTRWARVLVIVGLVVILIGTLDPLEGSLLILPGTALVALAAFVGNSRHRPLLYISFILVSVGVAALWGVSAIGGFGGPGRPLWWSVVLLPYPVGWLLSLVGAVRLLREGPGGTAGLKPRPTA